MPQLPAKAEAPNLEVIPSEEIKPQPAQEVELDAKTGKPVEAPKADTSISAEEFRKLQARFEYRERQVEKRDREIMERLERLSGFQPQPVISPTEKPSDEEIYGLRKDELNQLGQNDWTKPVQMMAERIAEKKAEEKFKVLMAEREKSEQERIKQQTTTSILEKEKAWVLEQEPSLNDETSEQFKGFYATYNKLIQEDPTLLSNPRAPRLVYREWRAEQMAQVEQSDPEKERLKRVAGGVSPQGRPTKSPNTIKLTQEEVDFCNAKGISPAVFAKMKDANPKEGVTA